MFQKKVRRYENHVAEDSIENQLIQLQARLKTLNELANLGKDSPVFKAERDKINDIILTLTKQNGVKIFDTSAKLGGEHLKNQILHERAEAQQRTKDGKEEENLIDLVNEDGILLQRSVNPKQIPLQYQEAVKRTQQFYKTGKKPEYISEQEIQDRIRREIPNIREEEGKQRIQHMVDTNKIAIKKIGVPLFVHQSPAQKGDFWKPHELESRIQEINEKAALEKQQRKDIKHKIIRNLFGRHFVKEIKENQRQEESKQNMEDLGNRVQELKGRAAQRRHEEENKAQNQIRALSFNKHEKNIQNKAKDLQNAAYEYSLQKSQKEKIEKSQEENKESLEHKEFLNRQAQKKYGQTQITSQTQLLHSLEQLNKQFGDKIGSHQLTIIQQNILHAYPPSNRDEDLKITQKDLNKYFFNLLERQEQEEEKQIGTSTKYNHDLVQQELSNNSPLELLEKYQKEGNKRNLIVLLSNIHYQKLLPAQELNNIINELSKTVFYQKVPKEGHKSFPLVITKLSKGLFDENELKQIQYKAKNK